MFELFSVLQLHAPARWGCERHPCVAAAFYGSRFVLATSAVAQELSSGVRQAQETFATKAVALEFALSMLPVCSAHSQASTRDQVHQLQEQVKSHCAFYLCRSVSFRH